MFRVYYERMPQELAKYFNLQDTVISVSTPEEHNQDFVLNIQLSLKRRYSYHQMRILDLSEEVNDIVYSFLGVSMTITFMVTYPEAFPFTAPIWRLNSCVSNAVSTEKMNKYIEDCVEIHNKKSKQDWSPAFKIHLDLLNLYCLIT
jgi:hypothetical protein